MGREGTKEKAVGGQVGTMTTTFGKVPYDKKHIAYSHKRGSNCIIEGREIERNHFYVKHHFYFNHFTYA